MQTGFCLTVGCTVIHFIIQLLLTAIFLTVYFVHDYAVYTELASYLLIHPSIPTSGAFSSNN